MRQKKTEQMEMLLAHDERSNSECYHGGKRRVSAAIDGINELDYGKWCYRCYK